KLVVHNHDSVFPHGGRNISAFALQHVNVPGNLRHLDLHLGKIGALLRQRCLPNGHHSRQQHRANSQPSHPALLPHSSSLQFVPHSITFPAKVTSRHTLPIRFQTTRASAISSNYRAAPSFLFALAWEIP